MELNLAPHENLCPLETLLSIYSPILECLVSHLPTQSKLALAQTSRSLRQLLFQHPLFFAHLDFRLAVYESPAFDTYPPGTVYNLDSLLQSLPVEGRITSLTLDWTAVSGYFLFNKILDRCQHTLEHLSVRGCRKVSIKHHIVPHFVFQTQIQPVRDRALGGSQPKPVLKSLYVYKARGVRRKPFLIDRKPADGDEPSRYLTTLCDTLGIWLDLGLCPTPRLRCPRRRELARRGKERFCVPFDRRWRVQEVNNHLSPVQSAARLRFEQSQGAGIVCWNCESPIPDRCDACVHEMTCSACDRALCWKCTYNPPKYNNTASLAPPGIMGMTNTITNHGGLGSEDVSDDDGTLVPTPLLVPCCTSAPPSHADNLCVPCHETMKSECCSLCDKKICIKHELDRCRRCGGGCGRIFCFTSTDSHEAGCGELETGRAGMRDCLGCEMEVCTDCRVNFALADARANLDASGVFSRSPTPHDDDARSESTISASGDDRASAEMVQKTTCNCRVCQENYYCPTCWPKKKLPCESRPQSILQKRRVLGGAATLLQVSFEESTKEPEWYTPKALEAKYPHISTTLLEEFETRHRITELVMISTHRGKGIASSSCSGSPSSSPSKKKLFIYSSDDDDIDYDIDTYLSDSGLTDIRDSQVEVHESEWILERVLAVKTHTSDNPTIITTFTPPTIASSSSSSSSTAAAAAGAASSSRPNDLILIPPVPPALGSHPSALSGRLNGSEPMVLCKWLGRGMGQVTWEARANFEGTGREEALVKRFERRRWKAELEERERGKVERERQKREAKGKEREVELVVGIGESSASAVEMEDGAAEETEETPQPTESLLV
ncbi:hypothetical protein EX30DRAFT_240009 [Ascodesmis nigricans]|uniref:F-box domain-containing protein n=1 Tax=Ascodesmis nigricans TaxID=341454 RepID=A0A4S2MYW9_9PEZI|nr:hypothetical protein EX30DRAFT_240009 [Ascodesmis nigricans]